MTEDPRSHLRTPSSELDARKLSTLRGRVSLTVEGGEHGMRLDLFLAGRMRWRSRTSVQKLIDQGEIEMSGRAPRASRLVIGGEEIHIRLPPPKRQVEFTRHLQEEQGTALDPSADPARFPLKILFEDQWLLSVDKPPGIPVHPTGRMLHQTIITELHHRYRVYDDPELDVEPKLCHRLDLETSGVLLIAKDDQVVAEVGRQLAARETEKDYLAIVHGVVARDEQIIDAPIGRARHSEIALRQEVRDDGGASRTGLKVEKRYRDFTLVRLRLFTGRRHQIRVHLASIGHPVVGDKIYGLDEDFFLAYYEDRLDAGMRAQLLLPRQALHSTRIAITHPIERRPLVVESPLAEDLVEFLKTLQ